MLEFINGIDWVEWAGIAALALVLFERIAILTPTKKDDSVVAWLKSIFSFLSLKPTSANTVK